MSDDFSFTAIPDLSRIRDLAIQRERDFYLDPNRLIPVLLRPCTVRVLLVTDGGLDFGNGDFGLSAFVETLLVAPGPYVRFEITLAHINSGVTDAQMLGGNAAIKARIKGFKFDNDAHFTVDKYDQVWLFGIATLWNRGGGYPSDSLAPAELDRLRDFMNGGGGVFATGDHGLLGRNLCGAVYRVRQMRLWADTSPDNNANEVSMNGPRRNDTNRIGASPGSQFNDQSDDLPQPLQLKLYSVKSGIWKYTFPHPLLCGPMGRIDVFPDHPHEGECVAPANVGDFDEWPDGVSGNPRPLGEVIATSSVLSGTVSGTKDPTIPHTFGAIAAYDGHRAGVGRVVTDATWHHFVNVNLIGEVGAAPPKNQGFLATPSGLAHLAKIRAYYRNIAVWISRPERISCMNVRLLWTLLWQHRVIEAVTTRLDVSLKEVSLSYLIDLGRHARDVLGKFASQCQSRRLALDITLPLLVAEFIPLFDPWRPFDPREPQPGPDPIPWFDAEPFLDAALGGALLALREQYPDPSPKQVERIEKELEALIARGATVGVSRAARSMVDAGRQFNALAAAQRKGV